MNNLILLIGFGFSANFGAPLTSELKVMVFNNLTDKYSDIKHALLDSDVEEWYENISNYGNENEKKEATRIIEEVLDKVNVDMIKDISNKDIKYSSKICNSEFNNFRRSFNSFIKTFAINEFGGSGYVFILNYDCLFEHLFMEKEQGIIYIPGIDGYIVDKYSENKIKIEESVSVKYANKQRALNFIKMHGSWNWRTHDGLGIIIGKNKDDKINKFNLLKQYMTKFQEIIHKNNTQLVIVGYSFQDQHINNVLIESIHSKNIEKLYIIDAKSFDNFTAYMNENYVLKCLLKHVSTYCPCTFEEICFSSNKYSEFFPPTLDVLQYWESEDKND